METFYDYNVEASYKRFKINEIRAYSESSTPSSPTTSGSKDTPVQEGGEIIYPIGRKAAKRKAKGKV